MEHQAPFNPEYSQTCRLIDGQSPDSLPVAASMPVPRRASGGAAGFVFIGDWIGRRLVICTLLLGAFCARSAIAATPATQPAALERFDYVAPKMGTVFHLVLYAPEKSLADEASAAVWARIDQLNATFSDYDPNTELSKLGQMTLAGPMSKPVPVSEDMDRLLKFSIVAGEQSEGTFDITVGPLTQLWRRSRRLEIVPTAARVAEAKKSVGYQHIELSDNPPGVKLTLAKMRLDVGGIAKGYAAVEMRRLLKEKFGITHVFCGAAGDIAVGDPPPGKTGWTIALESLDATRDGRKSYVRLANYGVSTSGDTERFVIIDGKRYSHIIDPATGYGLTNRINVTAVAPDTVVSDWMAAAVCILGPEKGLKLVERTPGTAARITKAEPDGIHVWESTRFHEFAVNPQADTQP